MTNVQVLRRMKLVEDITAAVLMVDEYGGKDTPGNMAVNTEKESSVPELCSLESVCGQACVRFTAILPGVSLPSYLSTNVLVP